MRKNAFESGRQSAKILAILSAVGCVASLMAGSGTVLQAALMLLTLGLFIAMYAVIFARCRCPHCGKVIVLGVWSRTVGPRCSRSLISGKKVKGNKR